MQALCGKLLVHDGWFEPLPAHRLVRELAVLPLTTLTSIGGLEHSASVISAHVRDREMVSPTAYRKMTTSLQWHAKCMRPICQLNSFLHWCWWELTCQRAIPGQIINASKLHQISDFAANWCVQLASVLISIFELLMSSLRGISDQ